MRWMLALVLLLVPIRAARAAPWEREIEESMLRVPVAHRAGSTDVRAGSWFTLAGFSRVFTAHHEVGIFAVLGLAFDRIATGPTHAISDRPGPPLPSPPAPPPPTATSPPPPPPPRPKPPEVRLVLDASLARGAVAAAWRTAGLGVDDAKIDAIVDRARLSAVLPETRLRVMRMIDDGTHSDAYVADDVPRYYDYAGTNLWLEARLTWRLDRLLYADDEPTLERVRLERIDARARVAAKILDLVFQWQRAVLDERDAPPGTREELDAHVRAIEAEIALDVLTNGWFSRTRARPQPEPRQSSPPS